MNWVAGKCPKMQKASIQWSLSTHVHSIHSFLALIWGSLHMCVPFYSYSHYPNLENCCRAPIFLIWGAWNLTPEALWWNLSLLGHDPCDTLGHGCWPLPGTWNQRTPVTNGHTKVMHMAFSMAFSVVLAGKGLHSCGKCPISSLIYPKESDFSVCKLSMLEANPSILVPLIPI